MLSKKSFKLKIILFSFIFLIISSSCSKNKSHYDSTFINSNTQVINKETNNSTEVSINDEDNEENVSMIYNNKGIPVLMYHSIDYEEGNQLRVPKEQFREQMNYLYENGYTTLTLNQLYDFFINNKPVPEKSVVLTFDDGYKDNYLNAFPILKEFNFNAVIFVITNNIDNHKNFLTSEQVIDLDNNGIEIHGHTANHERLSTLNYESQLNTLSASKTFLEKLLNKEASYTAYPYGAYNDITLKATSDAGYKMAFTTAGSWSDKTDGIFTLDRVYISANFDMNEFHRRLTSKNYNQKN